MKREPGGNRGLIAVLVGSALALVLLTVVTVVIISNIVGNDDDDIELSEVADDLDRVRAMRFTGTFDESGAAKGSVTVTKGRLSAGDLTIDGDPVKLVAVGANMYLRGDSGFWGSQSVSPLMETGDFATRWATAPASVVGPGVVRSLSLTGFVANLRAGNPVTVRREERVAGRPVRPIATNDYTAYVTTSRPHRIVRLNGSGLTSYQVDAAEIQTGQLPGVFAELRTRLKSLAGAVIPAQNVPQKGKPDASGCDTSGCTVTATFTQPESTKDSDLAIVMRAWITGYRKDGDRLGTCSTASDTITTTAVRLKCRITSPDWRSFATSSRPYSVHAGGLAQVVSNGRADDLLDEVDREESGA